MAASEGAKLAASFAAKVLTPGFSDARAARSPLLVPAAARELLPEIGMDDIIDALCKGTRPELGSTAAHGEAPSDNVFKAYLDSATLSLHGAEHFLPWLLRLCQAMEPAFGFVSARLIVDGERGRPQPVERDQLLVQLLGLQRLTLIRPVQGLPVTAPRPQPLLEGTLEAGDVLYVPACVDCRQAPSASRMPNVYVLVSLQSAELSLEFSLCKFMADLLLEQPKSSEADAFFRTSVTRQTKRELKEKPELEGSVQRFARELASKVTAAGLRKHFESRMSQLRKEQTESVAEVQALGSSGPRVLSRSLLRMTRGVQCRCSAGSSRAFFTRGSDTMTLNIADPIERICVCNVLMRKGCLELVDFSPPNR
ncbi:unnamed protein product [Effrenium voratum]|nr:unnamed protein product [Effrenium voratum]